ncbi:MAG TPA: hypothetical protein VIL48_13860 [Acidimicrobiales bacterium]
MADRSPQALGSLAQRVHRRWDRGIVTPGRPLRRALVVARAAAARAGRP